MNKKIAIFHNFLDNIGGAEIVTLSLARNFNAYIYTTNINTDKIIKMGYQDILPRIFSIGDVPIKAPYRHQLAFWKFRRLNLGNKYDLYIIAGDWAMSAAVNNRPNIWYVHSPLNEIWQFVDFIKKEILPWWKRPIFDIWVYINRKLSLRYSKYVGIWICNSLNTKNRIKKYYNKDALLINPPVDTSKYSNLPAKDYWLSVNRLLTHKRIDIQIRAFAKLPRERLIIVGSYEKGAEQFEKYKKYLENIKTDNIEIRNWVSDMELKKLYSECKGFIATARDEDFGLTPIEAMASGKPVIAPNEGGYKESMINGETGLLIDDIDQEKIIKAVSEIEIDIEKYKQNCIEQARRFDTKVFVEKIAELIR